VGGERQAYLRVALAAALAGETVPVPTEVLVASTTA
jgi:hypothetical protein